MERFGILEQRTNTCSDRWGSRWEMELIVVGINNNVNYTNSKMKVYVVLILTHLRVVILLNYL